MLSLKKFHLIVSDSKLFAILFFCFVVIISQFCHRKNFFYRNLKNVQAIFDKNSVYFSTAYRVTRRLISI